MDFEEFKRESTKMQDKVFVREDEIIINLSYEYPIPLSECTDANRILAWVDHLCGKSWMTVEAIEAFIAHAARHHNIDLPH